MTAEQTTIDVEALERGDLSAQDLIAQALGDVADDALVADSEDAGDGIDDGSPAAAEGAEDLAEGADLSEAIVTLGYIDTVLGDQTKFAEIPDSHKPVVASAVNAIVTSIQNAQRDAEQRGMQLGERMAVLDTLFRDDRDAFEEELAKPENRGLEAQFYEWRAAIAKRAGVDSEEMQQVRQAAAGLLNDLNGSPAWLDNIKAQAAEMNLRQTPEDLDKLRDLVAGAKMMIRFGFAAPPNQSAPAGAPVSSAAAPAPRTAAQRAQNAQRVASLPKPDIGGAGAKGRPLIDVGKLNESGAGSRLIEQALSGQS
jgi:hypothetical protein